MLKFLVVWGLDRGPLLWKAPKHVAAGGSGCLGPQNIFQMQVLHIQSQHAHGFTDKLKGP